MSYRIVGTVRQVINGQHGISEAEVRHALVHLLERQGVRCSEEDLAVIEVETRGGHPYFVIVGLNGTERPLGRVIARVAGRRRTSVGAFGVFLVRPNDVQRLVGKITA